jgi:nitrogen fixation protein NifU and related proteins
MTDLYRELILEHAKYPHNAGTLERPDISHEEHNPLCGDKVRIDLQVTDGVISDVRFLGRGCAISQAAASLLTDEIKGMQVEAARQITKEQLLELIGLPLTHNPVRLKCALLALKVLKTGLYGVGTPPPDEDEL